MLGWSVYGSVIIFHCPSIDWCSHWDGNVWGEVFVKAPYLGVEVGVFCHNEMQQEMGSRPLVLRQWK